MQHLSHPYHTILFQTIYDNEHLGDSCCPWLSEKQSHTFSALEKPTEICLDRQGAISAGSRLFMTNCEVSPQTVGGLVLTPAAAATTTASLP